MIVVTVFLLIIYETNKIQFGSFWFPFGSFVYEPNQVKLRLVCNQKKNCLYYNISSIWKKSEMYLSEEILAWVMGSIEVPETPVHISVI